MIKLLDPNTGCRNTINMKFIRNIGFLYVTNNSSEPHIVSKVEALGVANLRAILYYKLKQSTIQHHLLHYN